MIDNVANIFIKPGDENSKYYTKPDEKPISHPAEVLERLKKEKPAVIMELLIMAADDIVAMEIEARKKLREAEESAEAQIAVAEDKEEEVNSK